MFPTAIAFERRYGDCSGVEFGVRYDASSGSTEVRVHSQGNELTLPFEEIDWLIDALSALRSKLGEPA